MTRTGSGLLELADLRVGEPARLTGSPPESIRQLARDRAQRTLERAVVFAAEKRLGLLLTGEIQAVTVDPGVEDAVRALYASLLAGGAPVVFAGSSLAPPPEVELLTGDRSIDSASVTRFSVDPIPEVEVRVVIDGTTPAPSSAADFAALLADIASTEVEGHPQADLVVLTGVIAGPVEVVRPLTDPDLRVEVLGRLRGVPRSTLPPVWWNGVDVDLGPALDDSSSLFAVSTVGGNLSAELDTVAAELGLGEDRLAAALASLPAELKGRAAEPADLVRRGRALVDHLQGGNR
ncbi:MAG: hypothetical protein GY698_10490 [Actinomycetia bacterium]|nr:hypothetical protein [Actinomycetes bacterium]